MEAVGKYEFNATDAEELSFRKGDILKVLTTENEWYKAEMHGQEGFIPHNYIEMQIPSWFQENFTRTAAEEFLMAREVGGFLIRGSESSPGDFSISVKHECDVQHFKVKRDTRGQYFLWSEKFNSLNKLVEYYKTASISKQWEIYLNENPSTAQPKKSFGLEERGHTFGGHTGRRSPVGLCTAVQRTSNTLPASQPAATNFVRAMYDFKAEEDDELGFRVGDLIEVLDHSDDLWWKGRLQGHIGLFPANYTSPLEKIHQANKKI